MLTREVKVVYLLHVLASSILLVAAGDEVYGKKGGEITLSPGSLSGPLERIVWKHGDDKAIEWEAGQTVAYRQFRGSTTLDAKTGEMTITKLDSRFIGLYSSDVNGVQATKRWTLTLLDPVSKPIIVKNCTESKCELSCKNEATVKVQCAWRNGEEELRQSDGTLKLEKTDDKVGKAYICNCSNPVSFAVSDQIVAFDPGDEVYGKRGGEITLSPGSLSGPLERIVWKHGDDKAIEWEAGITDAYHQFKGSIFLDTRTGEMRITKLDSRFNGVYSSDVNGIQATKKWKLTVLGDEVYGKRGGEITLSPGSLSGSLTRIVWKHGDDKAIEWEGGQTDAYRQFRGSTTVNEKTGEMRITKLNSTFNGVYSSDVNGIQATKRWTLTVLDPVSKPIIVKNCTESKCELSCKNEATVKVQCAWRNGEEELRQSDGTLKLEKTDDKVGKAYICNCSNPVSFAVSDQIVAFDPEPPIGLIVGLLFLIIIIIIIGAIAILFKKQLKEFVQTCRGTRGNSDAANEGGAKEAVPLNKNAAGNQDGANETSEGKSSSTHISNEEPQCHPALFK
ncbi:uncharacterized protein LOC135246413 isoform X2 [Anguilla rostrata]|uniref:uncharacterized protein LOC135246413 isoform X2 n=1 Tax=Anguilla rostrata TaxID=7938 RepID=UPI0030D60DEC